VQQRDIRLKKALDPSVHATLVRELAQATRRVASASMELNAITRNFPHGIPPPRRTQSFENACRALGMAREEMRAAQKRVDDYINSGMVPDDLKPSG
jgi:hypothetical protein